MESMSSNKESAYEYANIDSINAINCDDINSENYIDLYDYENNYNNNKSQINNFLNELDRKIYKIFTIYLNLLKESKGFLTVNLIGFALYFTIIYILVTRF